MRCQSYCSAASVTCWWWASLAEWQIPTLQYHVIYILMEGGVDWLKSTKRLSPNPLLSSNDSSIPFQLRELPYNSGTKRVKLLLNNIAFLVVICENTSLCYAVHVQLVTNAPQTWKVAELSLLGDFGQVTPRFTQIQYSAKFLKSVLTFSTSHHHEMLLSSFQILLSLII